MKIYEVMQSVADVHGLVADGVLDEDAARDTLEGLMPIVEDRVLSFGAVVQNADAEIVALKAAKERIAARIQRAEGSIKWAKSTMLKTMEACDLKKVGCDDYEIRLQKNPVRVDVKSPELIPAEFMTTKTTKAPNKKALKSALQDGMKLEGVALVESNRVVFK